MRISPIHLLAIAFVSFVGLIEAARSQPVLNAVHADGGMVEFVPVDGVTILAASAESVDEMNGWSLHLAVLRHGLAPHSSRQEPVPLRASRFALNPAAWTDSGGRETSACEPARIVCLGIVGVYRSPLNSIEWRSTDPFLGRYGKMPGGSITIPLV